MNILISTHHLLQYAGTETQTVTIAKYLVKNQHTVWVYSRFLSEELRDDLVAVGANVTDSIDVIRTIRFDLSHVHHNIQVYEIRHTFPKLPIIWWMHGRFPFLEQKPLLDCNLNKILVNNRAAQKRLFSKGISNKDIYIMRNFIDPEVFYEQTPIRNKPQKALVLSNKVTARKFNILKQACEKRNISLTGVGVGFGQRNSAEIAKLINEVDIVFSLGVGAMESLFCGRAVIIADQDTTNFDEGLVTVANYDTVKEQNFSGLSSSKRFGVKDVLAAIDSYSPQESGTLKNRAIADYSAPNQAKTLLNLYKKAVSSPVKEMSKVEKALLNETVSMIYETELYTSRKFRLYGNEHFAAENQKLRSDLFLIQSSKFYRTWQIVSDIKRRLIRK